MIERMALVTHLRAALGIHVISVIVDLLRELFDCMLKCFSAKDGGIWQVGRPAQQRSQTDWSIEKNNK